MQIDRINELWALVNASGETYTKHEPYLYLTEKQAQQAADELAETARMHYAPRRLTVAHEEPRP
ncbi:MAG: hypothetical protein ACPG4T_15200 [Nannocystaceae bacterium]